MFTKENVHDGKMLKQLVNGVSENNDVAKVLADGAYDSKDNFEYLDKLKITPVIKVRQNSSTKPHSKSNCIPRKLSVLEQFKD
jgi:Transposase DDE domain